MPKLIRTICPVCNNTLNTSCYDDPNVGIPFDYDVLEEGTNCTCDIDDEAVRMKQAEHLEYHYWGGDEDYNWQKEFEEREDFDLTAVS